MTHEVEIISDTVACLSYGGNEALPCSSCYANGINCHILNHSCNFNNFITFLKEHQIEEELIIWFDCFLNKMGTTKPYNCNSCLAHTFCTSMYTKEEYQNFHRRIDKILEEYMKETK